MATLVKHSKRLLRTPCPDCGTGAYALYQAHNTDVAGDYCERCEVTGQDVLITQNGSLHICEYGEVTASPVSVPVPAAVVPSPVSTALPSPGVPTEVVTAVQTLMSAMSPKVDRADVEAIVKEQLANVVFPTRTVVERANGDRIELSGNTHPMVEEVITDLFAGEHVMMVGPAGTGKSTIAKNAAEALGLPFYSISLSPQTPASALLGYMDANGNCVRTMYREAYEHGGLFSLDEIDNGHASTLAVMNAGLAGDSMGFPDGMVNRHPDFRCVASANTYGKGADRKYVGRAQLDAATLDRFTIETVDVDEELESSICHATGLDSDTVSRVLSYVRRLRANAEAKGMQVVLSPRATAGMCRLMAAGKSWDKAVQGRVRRGMSDADWSKLTA